MLHRLRGLGLSAIVFDVAGGVGGTWYWNRYPGARCDVESMQYSYSSPTNCSRNGNGANCSPASRRFCATPIMSPTGSTCAATCGSKPASPPRMFDEATHRWTVRTDRGDTVAARFASWRPAACRPRAMPDFPGIDSFKGKTYHTGALAARGRRSLRPARRRHRHRLLGHPGDPGDRRAGRRIVTVFQRTPNFSIPSRNGPMPDAYAQHWKTDYPAKRAPRPAPAATGSWPTRTTGPPSRRPNRNACHLRTTLGQRRHHLHGRFNDLIFNQASNDTAAEFVRAKIRRSSRIPARPTFSPRTTIRSAPNGSASIRTTT